jgi:hypothetical protein
MSAAPEPAPERASLSKLPGATRGMRAADEDRDRVAAILSEALATGRLSAEEHAERLETTYSARYVAELAPLTEDLPGIGDASAPVSHPDSAPIRAIFSKIRRGGQWPVPPETYVSSTFGAAVIDLRQAVFTRREVVIHADSLFGKIEIIVPDNAVVQEMGTALFGKRSQPTGKRPKGTDGPVIRITGKSVFGHVRVMRGGFKWPWHENR